MPTYDYECPSCSSRFEKRRSFSDNSTVSCPECGCDARLLFSAVPIIFKGSGFYTTDHRGNHGHSTPTESSSETEKTKTDSTADNTKADSTADNAKADKTEESS